MKLKALFDFKDVFKILLVVWQSSKLYTIIRLVISAIMAVLPLVPLYLIKLLLDHFADAATPDRSYLIGILIAFAVVGIVQLILSNLSSYIALLHGDIIADYMSDMIVSKSVKIDIACYDSDEFHDVFQRAIGMGTVLPITIFSAFMSTFQNVILLLSIAGLLITLHWSIVFVLFFIAMPVAYIRYVYSEKTVALKVTQTQESRKANYLKNVLTKAPNAMEVRVFNYGKNLKQRFLDLLKKLRHEKRDLYKRQTIAISSSQSAETVAIVSALAIIVFRAMKGLLTVGDIALYFSAFQKGQSSINALLKSLVKIHENRLYVGHLFDFLNIEETIVDDPDAVPLQEPIDTIKMNNINFVYPGTSKVVLDDVSLTFEKGKVYAIVGENGSGKSTLVKLLTKLYTPSSGDILINDRPYNSWSMDSIRKKITTIFQVFVKYQLPLKDNVMISEMNEPMDPHKVEEALELSSSNTFVSKFKNGLDTNLGRWFKEGEELSGGQWQKIALARAFYKNADLIILDEPTSQIDPLAEDEIFQNLFKIGKDKILIMITHRIYNLKAADEIIVLDKGVLVEQGSHQQLIDKDGLYKKMFEKQGQT